MVRLLVAVVCVLALCDGAKERCQGSHCSCPFVLCEGSCTAGRTATGAAVVGYRSSCHDCKCIEEDLRYDLHVPSARAVMGAAGHSQDHRVVSFVWDGTIGSDEQLLFLQVQGLIDGGWGIKMLAGIPAKGSDTAIMASLELQVGSSYFWRLITAEKHSATSWSSMTIPPFDSLVATVLFVPPSPRKSDWAHGSRREAMPNLVVGMSTNRDSPQDFSRLSSLLTKVPAITLVSSSGGNDNGGFSLDIVGIHMILVPSSFAMMTCTRCKEWLRDDIAAAQARRELDLYQHAYPWIVLISDEQLSLDFMQQADPRGLVDFMVSFLENVAGRAIVGNQTVRVMLGAGLQVNHLVSQTNALSLYSDVTNCALKAVVEEGGGLKLELLDSATLAVVDSFGLFSRPKRRGGGTSILPGFWPLLDPKDRMPVTDIRLYAGVISTSKNVFQREAIRETWGSDERLHRLRFFIGRPHNDSDFDALRKEASKYRDIVVLQFMEESYDRIVHQTLAAFQFGTESQATHIFKCDDDTYVDLDRLFWTLSFSVPSTMAALGNYHPPNEVPRSGKWAVSEEEWPDETYPSWANGAGYVLTADLAGHISVGAASRASRQRDKPFRLEDVAVGTWIDFLKKEHPDITLVPDQMFLYGRQCREGFAIVHYVRPSQMRCMFRLKRCCIKGAKASGRKLISKLRSGA